MLRGVAGVFTQHSTVPCGVMAFLATSSPVVVVAGVFTQHSAVPCWSHGLCLHQWHSQGGLSGGLRLACE